MVPTSVPAKLAFTAASASMTKRIGWPIFTLSFAFFTYASPLNILIVTPATLVQDGRGCGFGALVRDGRGEAVGGVNVEPGAWTVGLPVGTAIGRGFTVGFLVVVGFFEVDGFFDEVTFALGVTVGFFVLVGLGVAA
jgi:hypothetical protein